jgi:glycosyltransferase involved in cell wall biosynthesis
MGGGEIALLNLVNHLDRGKVEPIVVLGGDGPLVERLKSQIETHVRALPLDVGAAKKDSLGIATLFRIREVLAMVGYVWRLSRFIRQERVDLVHTNSLKADVLGGLAGRLARRPVVWHVRDRIEEDYLPAQVVRLFRMLCRVVPTHVIANSAATLRTINPRDPRAAQGNWDELTASKKMSIVHDGTPLSPLVDSNERRLERFRVGLIGRISPWKGQDIFLRAAARVAKRFPDVQFVVIGAALFGEARYDEQVRALPKQLGIDGIVEFTGFRDDIHAAIADLDLVVHASTIGEPFGQVIIEGMAAGKPVVATNGGGVPEIVEDGRTGLLVPMGDVPAMADAICAILADPEKAAGMGALARQRVEQHFTAALTARRVEAVYVQVLQDR